MHKSSTIDIVDVCVFKNDSNLKMADLVVNFDSFDGSYDYNEANLTVIGFDENGDSYEIDFRNNTFCSTNKVFKDDCLLGEGLNIESALKMADDKILSELGFDYHGTLFWDPFPPMDIFVEN